MKTFDGYVELRCAILNIVSLITHHQAKAIRKTTLVFSTIEKFTGFVDGAEPKFLKDGLHGLVSGGPFQPRLKSAQTYRLIFGSLLHILPFLNRRA